MATECKLYRNEEGLSIPPNEWTLLTFEKAIRNDKSMQRDLSLIVPTFSGDFDWSRNIRWESLIIPVGDIRPRQFMSRFVRVLPNGTFDDTGADDRVASPGRNWQTVTWPFRGDAGEPVGVQVWHDHHVAAVVGHAQFVGKTNDY